MGAILGIDKHHRRNRSSLVRSSAVVVVVVIGQAMYFETPAGRKMYLIRITTYSAYFGDAVRFPGRGVLRDDGTGELRWQFPQEGMTKQRRSQWEEHGKIGRKAWFLSLLVGCVLCACGWLELAVSGGQFS